MDLNLDAFLNAGSFIHVYPTTSLASPVGFVSQLLNGVDRWELFSCRDTVESWLKGHHQKVLLVDSDWILRTLSPSNESSKDLNLQESIYMIQIHKSSPVVCRFADITTLSAEIVVIAVDISITYQSAGDSLAKLWVAHRSPLTYPRNTNYHAQAYAPAKIESRVYDLHNCLLHSYAAQSYQGIWPCEKRFGHGLDTIAFQLPRATPPLGVKPSSYTR